jgi:4-alpha-glucanotransferase
VYAAGTKERHLILFNNSAREERITISGADFCALFPAGAANLEWTNVFTGQKVSTERDQLLSQGYTMQLQPYQSAVLSGFTEAALSQAGKPAHALIPADRHYSGVAVPVAALRSRHSCGIGEFADLKLLIDWCAITGQSIINLLPVNDTGMNSSPYSALSAMALHPVYMRLDDLAMPQSMKARVAEMRLAHENRPRVAFQEIAAFKEKLLREIYLRDRDESIAQVSREFRDQRWLVEYAVYRHLKDRFGGGAWFQWNAADDSSQEVKDLLRDPEWHRIEEYFVHNIRQAGFYVWLQYHLHRQLTAVKEHADARGVFLKGDMPIMLERDSVDVWLNPQLFNHHLRAGAPPDMFSPEGQNWGFPVYNWPAHEQQNFSWWRERIAQLAKYFSAYRIDHVLGFFRLWCIEEGNYSGQDGFFQPAGALDTAELSGMGVAAEQLAALYRVRLADSEVAQLPAEALLKESGAHWLRDDLTHENGITSLGLRQDLQDQLWRRLHGRPLLKVGEKFFPAWAIRERLNGIESVPQQLKQVLLDRVAGLQSDDRPRQQAQGQKILSVLREAAAMLPCAEDLGVVPDYVRPTLAELGILSLKVYRWEAENNIPKDPQGYPFLSLATSSVHDSTNLREWLAGEPAHVTGIEIRDGRVTAEQVRDFLLRLYRSPSMIVMIPLQDLLALDAKYHGDATQERVNVPGTVSDFNWTYRMPVLLEDLLYEENLRDAVKALVSARPVSS